MTTQTRVPNGVTTPDEQAEEMVRQDAATKPWQPYLDAALGFRNHWYPALFGVDLTEGETQAVTLLGEPVLLKRAAGTVYAIRDQCAHRGSPFSARPECYSQNTITCWYHGFTYDVRNGDLVAVVTDPSCSLIGKLKLQTYPCEERQGLIFVFIGELRPTPPVVEDVQPGFLDEDLAVAPQGEAKLVKSNWRLAAENGIDASHIYIHRNSRLVRELGRALPLATVNASREGMVVDEPGKPKGVVKGNGNRMPVWEATIEGVKVTPRYKMDPTIRRGSPDTSLWLPCGVKVDPFPAPGIIQFEWYVPIDESSHRYMLTWGHKVASQSEAEQFFDEVQTRWKSRVVEGFNNDDVTAREAIERFYAEGDGWQKERLFKPDLIITEWRKLASRHNRGIQRRGDIWRNTSSISQ